LVVYEVDDRAYVLYALETLEGMRCVLLRMLEVLEMPEVSEVMHCVLLCLLEVFEVPGGGGGCAV